jgi:hypothetical protein
MNIRNCIRSLALVAFCFQTYQVHAQMRLPNTVSFAPMNDPWPLARDRWLDINNNQYKAWLTNGQPNGGFSYGNAQVQLTFDRAPGVPYFVGHIHASNLKPNFSYQLKLLGKPERGTRGWGSMGDDLSNERIGLAGRWWCDSSHASQTNFDDAHYYGYYKYAPAGREHNIYGYQYMGEFITDGEGKADVDITGQYSYHIEWASWQSGNKDTLFGTFPVKGAALPGGGFYGYGSTAPNDSVTMYYEYESGRPNPVKLPTGAYKCRFVLTEETFHNTTFLGGYWKGVLATEDYDAQGHADTNPANDVNFTIGANAPILTDVTPTFTASAAQGTQTFTAVYRDPDGDLRNVYLKVGDGANGLNCLYALNTNKLFAPTGSGAWQGGVAPGTAVELTTTSGSLLCSATKVTTVNGGVQVEWSIKAAAQWDGTTQAISTYATDSVGLSAGWRDSSWWHTGANQPPANVSLAPTSGSSAAGALRVLTAVYSDPNGADDISSATVKVAGTGGSATALRALYDARRNLLYLYKDDGVTLDGGFAPGSAHVITNSQGSLDCASTSVTPNGKRLTVNWGLTPASLFAGAKTVSLFVRDWQNAFDGFESFGTWTIAP